MSLIDQFSSYFITGNKDDHEDIVQDKKMKRLRTQRKNNY
jgi:hypothetical protein